MRNLGKLGIIALALMFVSASLIAQAKSETKAATYKGYLVDKMCGTGFAKSGDVEKATAKAKKHTKDCALEENCKASGYGLLIGAKFHKFDAAGDKLALSYLNKTKKESNLTVEVKGTMDGENINVA
jgi:hypothetical protein